MNACLRDVLLSPEEDMDWRGSDVRFVLSVQSVDATQALNVIGPGFRSAPIGVVTTPGTKSPKCVLADPRLPASPSGNTNF